MNERRKIDYMRYLTVFAITTLIFIAGIVIGNYFSTQKLEQVDYIGQDLKRDTMAMELQYELIAENPCGHINSTPLADELYDMASKLDYMENQLGEEDRDVIELKEYYSLLELRHWLFMQKTNKECNQNSSLIMFFYTNEYDCKKCKEQGFILTWIRKNYANVYVYSFDYAMKNTAMETVKKLFMVKGTPAVIIDKETYNRFMTKDELEQILQNNSLEKIETADKQSIKNAPI